MRPTLILRETCKPPPERPVFSGGLLPVSAWPFTGNLQGILMFLGVGSVENGRETMAHKANSLKN